VNATIRLWLAACKRRVEGRLNAADLRGSGRPIMTASNIHYETARRSQGIAHGGIGAMHALARRIGLIDAIDNKLHLLMIHMPYHESDHVLNFAYNALCDGDCLQDMELRRNNAAFLDALGARRIPDPTTAGDFCRRFTPEQIQTLLDVYHDVRIRVWANQPTEFFNQAIIDMDGHLVETTGQCKEGMDIAYDGTWGYHPLLLTLANTGEVLSVVNRSGNRPSHDGAAEQVHRCLAVCFRGGFRQVLLRGDTDFSQTHHLDRWNADPRVRFIFGYDCMANLVEIAEKLQEKCWRPLKRPPRYQVKTEPRRRPANVRNQVVVNREFQNLQLQSEWVAEFTYQPTACAQAYRMVVVKKNISVEKGEKRLFDEVRYFFYITNYSATELSAAEVVFQANDRCNQENLIAQLSGGVRALQAPVDNLVSNWAYMVMTALAWNLKAWWALTLPEGGRWQEKHRAEKNWVLRLEFKTFRQAFIELPCQIIRTGGRLVYRLLAWNPHLPIFFRLLDRLRC
jgi:hypothetical protein